MQRSSANWSANGKRPQTRSWLSLNWVFQAGETGNSPARRPGPRRPSRPSSSSSACCSSTRSSWALGFGHRSHGNCLHVFARSINQASLVVIVPICVVPYYQVVLYRVVEGTAANGRHFPRVPCAYACSHSRPHTPAPPPAAAAGAARSRCSCCCRISVARSVVVALFVLGLN